MFVPISTAFGYEEEDPVCKSGGLVNNPDFNPAYPPQDVVDCIAVINRTKLDTETTVQYNERMKAAEDACKRPLRSKVCSENFNGTTARISQHHNGMIATWGPVRRTTSAGVGFARPNEGLMSWAEYDGQINQAVRLLVMDGERVISPAVYNAIVAKWNDAKSFYETDTGKTPVAVEAEAYKNLWCSDGGERSHPPAAELDAQWVLTPELGFDPTQPNNTQPTEELLPCNGFRIITSPLMIPDVPVEGFDDQNPYGVSSILLSSEDGSIAYTATGGNYFAVETGLFLPAERIDENRGKLRVQCVFSEEAYLGQVLGVPAGLEAGIFENCNPKDFSPYPGTDGLWAPIQNARFRVSQGQSGFWVGDQYQDYVVSNANGRYHIPLSWPLIEFLEGALQNTAYVLAAGSILATAPLTYLLSAEIRYDVFNPRRPNSGYYMVHSEHSISTNQDQYKNYVVDATTLTIQAYLSKTPSRLGDEWVPIVGEEFGLGQVLEPEQEPRDFTEYDIQKVARGEILTEEGKALNQGFVSQIHITDWTNTDTYIFRESDGVLIGTRQGTSLTAVPAWDPDRPANATIDPEGSDCEKSACLFYSMITRGPGSAPGSSVRDISLAEYDREDIEIRDIRGASNNILDPNSWDYDQNGRIIGNGSSADALVEDSVAAKYDDRVRAAQFERFVRYGDLVRIVVINRATGYLASFRARVDAGPNGLPTYKMLAAHPDGYVDESFVARVVLRPPNLKIKVERKLNPSKNSEGEEEQGEIKIVGADGASITSDTYLQVTTEWFGESGEPLPDKLPGYTGRLARVVGGKLLAGTATENPVEDDEEEQSEEEEENSDGDDVGLFAIRPGKHIVNIQLPGDEGKLLRSHYYIHVSPAPQDELAFFAAGVTGNDKPDFSVNQVCSEVIDPEKEDLTLANSTTWDCRPYPGRENLVGRPARFVPFQVARFDKERTLLRAQDKAAQLQAAWEQGDPAPIEIDEIDKVYRWIYSPEMQFSVYDLDVKGVQVTTNAGEEDGDDPYSGVEVTYDLRDPSDGDGLARAGNTAEDGFDDGLYWGIGYDKIKATVTEDGGDTSVDKLADKMGSDDFLGLDLFVDGDEANTLYEIEDLSIILANARHLTFGVLQLTSLAPDGSLTSIQNVPRYHILNFVTTRETNLRIYFEWKDVDGNTRTEDHLLPTVWTADTTLPGGEHRYVAVDTLDLPPEITENSGTTFEVVIKGWESDKDEDEAVHTHYVRYPSIYLEKLENVGEGISLGEFGKMASVVSAADEFADVSGGGASPEASSARGGWSNGGSSLTDGSLKLARQDLGASTIGPELSFSRSYTNLDDPSSDSTLGIGWRHSFDIQLIPIALEGDEGGELPTWYKNLKANSALIHPDAWSDTSLIPNRWGEVIVKGARFKRDGGGAWMPELGFQGHLAEVGDNFEFTDVDGTIYTFPIPKIPIPEAENPAGEDGTPGIDPSRSVEVSADLLAQDMGDMDTSDMDMDIYAQPDDGLTPVHYTDRLIYRIRAETVVIGDPDMGSDMGDMGDMGDMDMSAASLPDQTTGIQDQGPQDLGTPQDMGGDMGSGGGSNTAGEGGSPVDRVGRPQITRPTMITAPNKQKLVLAYDANAPERLLSVLDDFGRTLDFDYIDCNTENLCDSNSTATTRLHRVRLLDGSGAVLGETKFDYYPDGHLRNAVVDGRPEVYEYNGDMGASERNLVSVNVHPSGAINETTKAPSPSLNEWYSTIYTYHQPAIVDPVEVNGVPVLREEVLKTIEHPTDTNASGPLSEPAATISYSYTRDGSGQLQREVTDARGNTTRYILNSYGKPILVYEPLGRMKRMTWSMDHVDRPGNFMTSMAVSFDAEGQEMVRTRYGQELDADGLVIATWTCGPELIPTTQALNDTPAAISCDRNAADEITEYDPRFGVPTKYTDRRGLVDTWTYNDNGMLLSSEDATGVRREISYIESGTLQGLKLSEVVKRPGGATLTTSTFQYDLYGQLAQTTVTTSNPLGTNIVEVHVEEHDHLGRLIRRVDPAGNEWTYEYNDRSNMTRIVYPNVGTCPSGVSGVNAHCSGGGEVTMEYDLLGNKIREQDLLGVSLEYDYTARGKLRSMTRSADGRSRYFTYDANGNLLKQSDWLDDPASLGDANAETYVSYEYDELGRMVKEFGRLRDAQGDRYTSTMTYDYMGNVISSTNAEGVTQYMEYDALNRPIAECAVETCDVTTGRTGPLATMTYFEGGDADSNLKEQNTYRTDDTFATTKFEWDDGYRLTKITDPLLREQIYEYDDAGRLISETSVEGKKVEYTRDGMGRVLEVFQSGNDGEANVTRKTEFVLDPLGRPVTTKGPEKDLNGAYIERHMTYDAWGRLIRREMETTDEGGLRTFATEFVYDKRGDVVWSRNAAGEVTTYTYDGLGRMVSTTNAAGETRTQSYDVQGNVVEVVAVGDTNAPDIRTCMEYDARGLVVAQHVGATSCAPSLTLAAEGRTSTMSYNKIGLPVESVDGFGRITRPTYDGLFRAISSEIEEAGGQIITGGTTTYGADGRVLSQTDPLGNTVTYTYDLTDRILSMSFEENSGAPDRVAYTETYAYTNNEVIHTDRAGLVTKKIYNDFDEVIEVQIDEGAGFTTVAQMRHDIAGRPTQVIDALGNTTDYSYFARGMLAKVESPAIGGTRAITEYEYDDAARPIKVIDPLDHETTTVYDDVGRPVSVTRFAHDATHQETMTMSYDALGRLTERTRPVGGLATDPSTKYLYDRLGRMLEVDESGLKTNYTYNAADQITTVTGPNALDLSYSYDGFGRVLTITRQSDCQADFTGVCPSSAQITQSYGGYDILSNPTTMTDGEGRVTTMTYDGLGRLSGVTYPTTSQPTDTATPKSMSLAYDDFNRVVESSIVREWTGGLQATSIQQTSYDLRGRLDNTHQEYHWYEGTTANNKIADFDFGYDANSNLTCFSTSGSTGCANPGYGATLYEYDERHRVKRVTVAQPNPANHQHTDITYDNANRPLLMAYPNGVHASIGYHDSDPNTGDLTSRPSRLKFTQGGTGFLGEIEYDYYKGGLKKTERRVGLGDADEVRDYQYDALARLKQSKILSAGDVTQTDYEFDGYNRSRQHVQQGPEGGMLTSVQDLSYKWDEASRLLEVVDSVAQNHDLFEWDDNGNLTKWTKPTEERVYHYNALDQLVQVDRGPPNMLEVVGRYDYDASGMRTLVDAAQSTDASFIRLYAGGRTALHWEDGATSPQRHHWLGSQHFALDVGTSTASDIGYYHSDLRGDVLGLSDDLGSLVGKWSIDPFGNPLHRPDAAATGLAAQRHGFTGHLHDRASELVYMRARYYSPELGVFLTQDPAAGNTSDPRSRRKHQYAHSDPINAIDPTGRSTVFLGQHDNSYGTLAPGGDSGSRIVRTPFDWSSYEAFQGQLEGFAAANRLSEINALNQQIAGKINEIGGYMSAAYSLADDILLNGAGKAINDMIHGRKNLVDVLAGPAVEMFKTLEDPTASGWDKAMALTTVLDFLPMGGQALRAIRKVAKAGGKFLGGSRAGVKASKVARVAKGRANTGVQGASDLNKRMGTPGSKSKHKTDGNLDSMAKGSNPKRQKDIQNDRGSDVGEGCLVPRNSFSEDTPVVMCDGSTKAISEIEEGDEVLSRDPETGETACKPVTNTIDHPEDDVVELVLRDENGKRIVIVTTWEHPVMLEDGTEAATGLLQPGELVGAIDGAHVVEAVSSTGVSTTVYNLTVDDFHTFFVGHEGSWVHNQQNLFANGGLNHDNRYIRQIHSRLAHSLMELATNDSNTIAVMGTLEHMGWEHVEYDSNGAADYRNTARIRPIWYVANSGHWNANQTELINRLNEQGANIIQVDVKDKNGLNPDKHAEQQIRNVINSDGHNDIEMNRRSLHGNRGFITVSRASRDFLIGPCTQSSGIASGCAVTLQAARSERYHNLSPVTGQPPDGRRFDYAKIHADGPETLSRTEYRGYTSNFNRDFNGIFGDCP